MATSEQFKLGSVYDFITYAPSVLGNFKNVRIEGIVDHRAAYQYADVAAMHANVYGSLPEQSAPNDFRKYYYVIVLQPNGTRLAIGLPWIDVGSVELKERNRVRVTIEDVGPDDLPSIKRMLSANGYHSTEVILE